MKHNESINILSQKQMKHIIILLVELIKNNSKLWEKNTVVNSNFKYLYKQALTIFNWMSGNKKGNSIDSSISPRLNEDSFNDEDLNETTMLKVSPFTTKMDIGFKKHSVPNKEMNLTSFRSNSNKHRIKNFSILESLRDPVISRPIIVSKKNSVNPTTSNRRLRDLNLDRSSIDDKYIMY